MASLQVKDVPEDLHRELRRRADLDGLSIRDYLLRLTGKQSRGRANGTTGSASGCCGAGEG
jgi:hypothetical protein